MMTRHYKVAGHTFAVSGSNELFERMENYEPFRCEGGKMTDRASMANCVFMDYL